MRCIEPAWVATRYRALLTALLMLGAATAEADAPFDAVASFQRFKIGGVAPYLLDGSVAYSGVPGGHAMASAGPVSLTGTPGAETIVIAPTGSGSAEVFAARRLSPFTNRTQPHLGSPGSIWFTNVPNIQNLFLTLQNGTGTFAHGYVGPTTLGNQFDGLCASGCFGGEVAQRGRGLIAALGYLTVPIPLSIVGFGGQATAQVGSAIVVADAGPWVTENVVITAIATNLISITNNANARQGLVGAAFTIEPTLNEGTLPTASGLNAITVMTVGGSQPLGLDGTASGQVTLVSPMWIDASELTNGVAVPGAAFMTLVFVPEPGALLLLASATATLLLIGRGRMRR